MNQRLMLYKKVAAARTEEEIDRVLEEATDRYGPLPASVLNLADYGRIRVMADRLGIDSIDREGRLVVLKFRPQAKLDPVRLLTFVRERPELTVAPPASLKLEVIGDSGLGVGGGQVGGSRARPNPQSPIPNHLRRGRESLKGHAPSWWTARARETEVKPGFTKAELTRGAKEDPSAPGGVFERVGALLSDLLEQV
jgi:hypothetical protein